MLTKTDFEAFSQLADSNTEGHWTALEKLTWHQNDHLLLEEEYEFKQLSPCRLVTFSGLDAATPLYALATKEGRIILGKSQSLRENTFLNLGEYDPEKQEIIAMAITGQTFFMGNSVNLWISVKGFDDQSPYYLVYRALAGFDSMSKLKLIPIHDNEPENHALPWRGTKVDKDKLPIFLSTWNFSSSYHQNPFRISDEMVDYLKHDLPPIDVVQWQDNKICYALDKNLVIKQLDSDVKALLLDGLSDRINALALTTNKNISGIVACDNRELIYFKQDQDKLNSIWRQELPDFPIGLGFTQGNSTSDQNSDGFPLLVISRNGCLRRLAYIKPEKIVSVLANSKNALKITDLSGLISTMSLAQMRTERKKACLCHLMQLLNDTHKLSANELDRHLRAIFKAKFFVLQQQEHRLPDLVTKPLIQITKLLAEQDNRQIALDTTAIEHLSRWIYQLYDEQLGLADRQEIDRHLHGIHWNNEFKSVPHLQQLQHRVEHTLQQYWLQANSNLDNLLQSASVSLEYWANQFLSSETVLFKKSLDKQGLSGLQEIKDHQGNSYLLALTTQAVNLYSLSEHANRQPLLQYKPQASETRCVQILPLYHKAEREFVVLTNTGQLSIFTLPKTFEPQTFDRKHEFSIKDTDNQITDTPTLIYNWTAASCPTPDQSSLLLIVGTRSQSAKAWLYRYTDQKPDLLNQFDLEIPWLNHLDFAQSTTGYEIAAAGDQSGTVYLFHLDVDGNLLDKTPKRINIFRDSTLSLTFDAKANATRLISGGYSGLIWCVDLSDQQNVQALPRWIYGLKGSVRSLQTIVSDNKPYVLAGSGLGEFCLFDLQNGRRIWKETLRSSIRHICPLNNNTQVALGLTAGWVTLFDKIDGVDQYKALTRIEDCLNQLTVQTISDKDRSYVDYECVLAFFDLKQKKSPKEVLANLERLEARARFLRYVLKITPIEQIPLEDLSYRELGLVLAYQDSPIPALREACWQELKQRPFPPECEVYAYEMATATNLQALSQENLDIESLLVHKPNDQLLERSVWLRTEYARLLIIAGRNKVSPGECLFVKLLPYVLQMSLQLLPYLQLLSVADEQLAFQALDNLLHYDKLSKDNILAAVKQLTSSLTQHSHSVFGITILAHLGEIHGCVLQNQDHPWLEWRDQGLDALTKLQTELSKPYDSEDPLNQFLQKLRNSVFKEWRPADTQPIEDRLRWVETARRKFDTPVSSTGHRKNKDWDKFVDDLLKQTRKVINDIMTEEHKHLVQLVRPYAKLADFKYLIGGKVAIELALQAESQGQRRLKDVTIVVDAARETGLQFGKDLKLSFSYMLYPNTGVDQNLVFKGSLHPNQKKVLIQITTTGEGGYQDVCDWYFNVPTPPKLEADSFAISQALPELFSVFSKQLRHPHCPVSLGVYDAELDLSLLMEDWDINFPHRRLDMNLLVKDIGPNRFYSAANISANLLTQALTHFDTSLEPVLIAPADALLQRLIDGESPGVLEAFWQHLKSRTSQQPALVLLVESSQANSLRQLGMADITELQAHHLLIRDQHLSTAKQLLTAELLTLISQHTTCTRVIAENYSQIFGFDVRYILDWLRQLKSEPQFLEPKHYLAKPSVKHRILAELASLDAISSIFLLLGVRSQTQILRKHAVPGLISAVDYYSTTRKHEKKRIQKSGAAFDSRSLTNINADASPPQHLQVQGLSYEHGSGETQARAFFHISQRIDANTRQKALRSLHDLGYGDFKHGIFRTGSPYRELILDCYSEARTQLIGTSDSYVYAQLFGDNRMPLDILSDDCIRALTNEDLSALLPHIAQTDLKRFRTFQQLWHASITDTQFLHQIEKQIFSEQWIALSTKKPDLPRWDQPLLSLGEVIFGTEQSFSLNDDNYPVTYWFWLTSDSLLNPNQLRTALSQCERLYKQAMAQSPDHQSGNYPPRIVLAGAGAETWPVDEYRQYAVLRIKDINHAAWSAEDLMIAIKRKLRAQLRLSAFSPFKINGALPPNSSIFKGREDELEFMKTHCRKGSTLIIGSRRVGKTSLLNQFLAWAEDQPDLAPLFLDLQGIDNRSDLFPQLSHQPLIAPLIAKSLAKLDVPSVFTMLIEHFQQQGKIPLFLLNEIDGIARYDPALVEFWRGLNDRNQAHFMLTGYTIIGDLGLPTSAFFHFTEGPYYGGKAIALSTLSDQGATDILDLLETSLLHLTWRSDTEKAQAYALLLERSYRIPWVLQVYGRALVEYLEAQRRDCLVWQDVNRLLTDKKQVVWQYINDINYQDFANGGNKNLHRAGFFILLYIIARAKYFTSTNNGIAPIRDKRLKHRKAIDLSFTTGDATAMINKALAQLPIFDNEKSAFTHWFKKLDIARAFRLLTLTLILEPDPNDNDRYAFLLHIFPTELNRQYGDADPTLIDLLMRAFAEFLNLSPKRG